VKSWFFWTCPPFHFGPKWKTVFWSKTEKISQSFIKNFIFFKNLSSFTSMKHWKIFFNFLSMTIIVFDVLNNELRWNRLKNYKLREIFENIFPVFSLSQFFLPPSRFFISSPVWHVQKNCDFTLPKFGLIVKIIKFRAQISGLHFSPRMKLWIYAAPRGRVSNLRSPFCYKV
jgi:hypothetical protein